MGNEGNTSVASFTEGLAVLRRALADADPLAATAQPEQTEPFSATAETMAAAFAGASTETRQRFLLRALDDAIAAIEVAARLADELHLPAEGAEGEADALQLAYRAFTQSQPAYQALYHYRNTLAARLQLDERQIPEAVSASPADTDAAGTETSHAEHGSTALTKQPRSRSRKPAGGQPS